MKKSAKNYCGKLKGQKNEFEFIKRRLKIGRREEEMERGEEMEREEEENFHV